MNQSDEDALLRKAWVLGTTYENSVRNAIRAAYAKGAEDAKERAANKIEERALARHGWDKYKDADAIRRG